MSESTKDTEKLKWEEALGFMRRGHKLTRQPLEAMGLHLEATTDLHIITLQRTDTSVCTAYCPTDFDRSSTTWKIIR